MSESTVAAAASVPPHRRWDATEEDAMDGRTQASGRQQRPPAREGRREAEGRGGGGGGTPGRENNR